MRDTTFGPTVLVGLASAALTAVAAGRDWATSAGDAAGVDVTAAATGSDAAPLALALALVALASWGAILVLRGRVRRGAALLGLLAAGAVVGAVAVAFGPAQDAAREAVTAQGATGDVFVTSLTAWYWTTGVAAAVSFLTLARAVVKVRDWPAMGSRYDAPSARAAAPAADEDLWRALDQGHDPTA